MSEKTLGEKFRDFVSFTGPAIPEEIAPGPVEGRELPRYRSHKVVHALKIKEVMRNDIGGFVIIPADDGFDPIEPYGDWIGRFKGLVDDLGYYVRYEDGYESWSPTKAFEEGYTRTGSHVVVEDVLTPLQLKDAGYIEARGSEVFHSYSGPYNAWFLQGVTWRDGIVPAVTDRVIVWYKRGEYFGHIA